MSRRVPTCPEVSPPIVVAPTHQPTHPLVVGNRQQQQNNSSIQSVSQSVSQSTTRRIAAAGGEGRAYVAHCHAWTNSCFVTIDPRIPTTPGQEGARRFCFFIHRPVQDIRLLSHQARGAGEQCLPFWSKSVFGSSLDLLSYQSQFSDQVYISYLIEVSFRIKCRFPFLSKSVFGSSIDLLYDYNQVSRCTAISSAS